MNAKLQNYLLLFGRILLAVPFLPSGIGKIPGWATTLDLMRSEGMMLVEFFLAAAIFFEIAASLLLIFGYKERLGAAMLIAFLIPATVIFHDFWAYTGQQGLTEWLSFTKNLGLIGGLTFLGAVGGGDYALDRVFNKQTIVGKERINVAQ